MKNTSGSFSFQVSNFRYILQRNRSYFVDNLHATDEKKYATKNIHIAMF